MRNLKCLEFTHSVVRTLILSIKPTANNNSMAKMLGLNRAPADFRFLCAISHLSCKFVHVEMCSMHVQHSPTAIAT